MYVLSCTDFYMCFWAGCISTACVCVLMMLEFWCVHLCVFVLWQRPQVHGVALLNGLFQRFVTVLLGPAVTARARSPPRLCSPCARRPLVVLTAHHCCHPPCARAPAPGPGNVSTTTTPTQNRCRHRGQTQTPTGHTHTRCTLQLRRLFIYSSQDETRSDSDWLCDFSYCKILKYKNLILLAY